MEILLLVAGLFLVLISVTSIVAWVKIFTKAGYSGDLVVLMLIPLVNIITFLWFAFTTWPIERRVGWAGRAVAGQPTAHTPGALREVQNEDPAAERAPQSGGTPAAGPRMLVCPNCGHHEASDRTSCPHCGMSLMAP